MVAGEITIKESNPVFAHSIAQAGAVSDSVESAAQEELGIAAAVRQVADVSRLDVTIGPWHWEASDR